MFLKWEKHLNSLRKLPKGYNRQQHLMHSSMETDNFIASVGLKPGGGGSASSCPTYTFDQNNTNTYSKDFFASRYQM
jgi:hypothetical protein